MILGLKHDILANGNIAPPPPFNYSYHYTPCRKGLRIKQARFNNDFALIKWSFI